jgi:hypothetical protein
VPCSDPRALPDSAKVAISLAVNAAFRDANAPAMLTIMTIRKNITGNLLLTPSAQTLTTDITAHLPAITEDALNVHPSLLPPRLNEK